MLERPNLEDERIIACLQEDYGLNAVHVAFLPRGADLNTAVYRVVAGEGVSYFLKLRRGIFDETSVTLPKFLSDQGIAQIIAPLITQTGQFFTSLDPFKVILYPFVEGRDGYEVDLSDRHWHDLGAALKRTHAIAAPPALASRIRQETYSSHWRECVKIFLGLLDSAARNDPVAVDLVVFLQCKHAAILDLIQRAEQRSQVVQANPSPFVLCHSDVHAGNILIDGNDALYIVDWDDPILAPKERDLMFVGGGQGFSGHTPQEEETLFYQAYGPTQINSVALAYYRYERIIQDIAVYCEQLLLTDEGGEDREQSLHYMKSNFLPNGTIEIAYQSDMTFIRSY